MLASWPTDACHTYGHARLRLHYIHETHANVAWLLWRYNWVCMAIYTYSHGKSEGVDRAVFMRQPQGSRGFQQPVINGVRCQDVSVATWAPESEIYLK